MNFQKKNKDKDKDILRVFSVMIELGLTLILIIF